MEPTPQPILSVPTQPNPQVPAVPALSQPPAALERAVILDGVEPKLC